MTSCFLSSDCEVPHGDRRWHSFGSVTVRGVAQTGLFAITMIQEAIAPVPWRFHWDRSCDDECWFHRRCIFATGAHQEKYRNCRVTNTGTCESKFRLFYTFPIVINSPMVPKFWFHSPCGYMMSIITQQKTNQIKKFTVSCFNAPPTHVGKSGHTPRWSFFHWVSSTTCISAIWFGVCSDARRETNRSELNKAAGCRRFRPVSSWTISPQPSLFHSNNTKKLHFLACPNSLENLREKCGTSSNKNYQQI